MTENDLHVELAALIAERHKATTEYNLAAAKQAAFMAEHLEKVGAIRAAIAAKVSERRAARHARQKQEADGKARSDAVPAWQYELNKAKLMGREGTVPDFNTWYEGRQSNGL